MPKTHQNKRNRSKVINNKQSALTSFAKDENMSQKYKSLRKISVQPDKIAIDCNTLPCNCDTCIFLMTIIVNYITMYFYTIK